MKKCLSLFFALILTFSVASSVLFPSDIVAEAAETTKMIKITSNTDINPFIRVFLSSKLYKKGGPFTVKCDIKIEKLKKTKGDGKIFVNIQDGRDKTKPVHILQNWTKTCDWQPLKDAGGKDITFNNIDKVLIDANLQEYGLLNMGSIYADSVVCYRNFRILDASGKIVYSWDTDPDFKGLTNLKNIKAAEPLAMAITFGDGSGTYEISDVPKSGNTDVTPGTPSASDGPVFEDESSSNISTPSSVPSSTPNEVVTSESEVSSSADSSEILNESSSQEITANNSSNTNNISGAKKDKTEKKNMLLPILLIVLAVIIILAAVILLILNKKGKIKFPWQKENDDQDSSPTE